MAQAQAFALLDLAAWIPGLGGGRLETMSAQDQSRWLAYRELVLDGTLPSLAPLSLSNVATLFAAFNGKPSVESVPAPVTLPGVLEYRPDLPASHPDMGRLYV